MTDVELSADEIESNDPRAVDEVHRLLGRLITSFSRYTHHLEVGIRFCLGADENYIRKRMVMSLTGELSENSLRSQFFAMTALVREPTGDESKIRANLNSRGQILSSRRNDAAHGLWSLGSTTFRDGELVERSYEPSLMRTKAPLSGSTLGIVLASRSELRVLADDAQELGDLVWAYVCMLFPKYDPQGLAHCLRMENGQAKLVGLPPDFEW